MKCNIIFSNSTSQTYYEISSMLLITSLLFTSHHLFTYLVYISCLLSPFTSHSCLFTSLFTYFWLSRFSSVEKNHCILTTLMTWGSRRYSKAALLAEGEGTGRASISKGKMVTTSRKKPEGALR